jgi:hypothetical protein
LLHCIFNTKTQVKAVRQETAGSCGFQRVPEAGFQNRFRRPYTACFPRIPEPENDFRIRLPFPSRFPSTDTIIYQDDRIRAVSHHFRSGNEGRIRSFSDPLYSWDSAYRYDHKMCPITGSLELLFVCSKSEYTIESVSVSGRPSVYTITLQRLIRL